MTIENPEAYAASQWDWECLAGCFGETKIKPTDIDGFVERNGKFLVIETKLPGVPLKTGQELTFKRLIKTQIFTVLLVWGKPGEPIKMRAMTRKADTVFETMNIDKLRSTVRRWFEYANGDS